MANTPERIGYYCWAGPGTIRMINLKFFSPKIDHVSLMGSYEYDYLARVQETFGVTDFWATYSWGFGPRIEAEDYAFLISKVENFKKLGIRLHAYIQGTNIVYRDFADKNWYSRDDKGRTVTYHRGRKIACVNNPDFREFMREKITGMYHQGFDGIYMDNPQMGQTGLARKNHAVIFSGCSCDYCTAKFHARTGEEIPVRYRHSELFGAYQQFRTDSMSDFIVENARLVHAGGMLFGTNSFDPRFDLKTVFGLDLDVISRSEDYLLFENHAAPCKNSTQGNEHAQRWTKVKPVFVVSYKKGIGKEQQYSQRDFDQVFSEASSYGFSPCIKGSEYVTGGIWHNLNPELYKKPRRDLPIRFSPTAKKTVDSGLASFGPSRYLLHQYYNPLFRLYMENPLARRILDPLYFRTIR